MKRREQQQEGQESEAEEEEEPNNSETAKSPSKKKQVPSKPEPPLKVSNKSKGGKPLPYPGRQEKLIDSEEYDSFVHALKDLCLQLPLTGAIQVPTYTKFLMDILNRTKNILESVVVVTSHMSDG